MLAVGMETGLSLWNADPSMMQSRLHICITTNFYNWSCDSRFVCVAVLWFKALFHRIHIHTYIYILKGILVCPLLGYYILHNKIFIFVIMIFIVIVARLASSLLRYDQYPGHVPVTLLSFSPDGHFLVSACPVNSTMLVRKVVEFLSCLRPDAYTADNLLTDRWDV